MKKIKSLFGKMVVKKATKKVYIDRKKIMVGLLKDYILLQKTVSGMSLEEVLDDLIKSL